MTKRRRGAVTVAWFAFACSLGVPGISLAAGGGGGGTTTGDNVLSANIKEADGATGQDTNSGSGVKTGHIQNGAVTDVKIAGPISASKVQPGYFMKKYAFVVVVAKSGGDFADPVTAMASISDASASRPYLVKIMPGVYDLGASALPMKSHVDVEGSGEGVTVLAGTGSPNAIGYYRIVEPAAASELRSITVEARGPAGQYFYAITGTAPSSIRDVTIRGIGDGTGTLGGIWYYSGNNGSAELGDVTLTRVTIRIAGAAMGGGIVVGGGATNHAAARVLVRAADVRASGSSGAIGIAMQDNVLADVVDSVVRVDSPSAATAINGSALLLRVQNVIAEAPGFGGQAIVAYSERAPAAELRVDHSTLVAPDSNYGALRNIRSNVFAAYSRVEGPILKDPPDQGTNRCIGLYDANYAPVTCP